MLTRQGTLLSTMLVLLVTSGLAAQEPAEELFRNRIAPLFQQHCFACHNNTDQKGDFSLETRESLLESGMLEPGDPQGSHLLEMLVGSGGKRAAMPKDSDPLQAQDVQLIADWIKSGAIWPDGYTIREAVTADLDWWSFKPLSRPSVPVRPGDNWSRTSIDRFILDRLREEALVPSPEADRRTLIRRLTFDLTGLPPSPRQVDHFLQDPAPDAYEQLVDRLLTSPAYGERWARHWLDVVKYADTCGYDKDKLRPNSWPYRDYVIRSWNDDKPYGRFVQEQLAGDVLFPGEADGILGLGFIAAGPWDFIGHVEVPETKIDGRIARHIDRDEMVTNTLNTFCSVTIQCARCHNHKFDPFTQRHYYNLQTIFAAVDRAERVYDADPGIQQQRTALNAQLASLRQQRTELEATIQAAGGGEFEKLQKQQVELLKRAALKPKHPAYGFHSSIESKQETTKWVQVDLGQSRSITSVVLRPCHDEYKGIGAGFGFPLRFRLEASDDANFATGVMLLEDRTATDVANPGIAPWKITLSDVKARYVRVTATRLVERSGDYILALAELQLLDSEETNLARGAKVHSPDSIEASPRWGRANLTDGIYPQARDEAAAIEATQVARQLQTIRERIYTPERRDQLAKLSEQLTATEKQLSSLPVGRMVYAAATHFKAQGGFQPTNGTPRQIHLLHRGNILDPRTPSRPGTVPVGVGFPVEFELGQDHQEGSRRVALARWITRPDHPLTWRSIVNRLWHYHFGQGIVNSPNDFGRMGQLPTHPRLLDWLATELIDNGQSIKSIQRLIVTSSVYRQTSEHREQASRKDASNQFLWRMNRRRLEAEEIRDAILATSGRLDNRMYGAGYYLFVLEKTEHSPHYEYYKHDPEDPASHRRTIYRFIVRSQPDPFMTTLDCADSSQSTPKRNETLTSLQALSLLNHRFNLSMAQHFAIRLKLEAGDLEGQVTAGFRLVTGRSPTASEHSQLVTYAREHGLANACRLLLNLSEFIFLD
jgi:mono/diheme cytochrome c family protein